MMSKRPNRFLRTISKMWLFFVSKYYYTYSLIAPYKYDRQRYKDTLLFQDSEIEEDLTQPLQRVIYCCWTGDNPMTSSRAKNIAKLGKRAGVEVKLITTENIDQYELADYPIHSAYKYLSCVHKSDYLRCYLMHHYGGGYADIKRYKNSWESSFDMLENSNAYILGYPETDVRAVAFRRGVIGKDMAKHWRVLIGAGAFICRRRTKFTHEWYQEVHRRMDYYKDALKRTPGNIFGDNPGYPIPWLGIMGNLFHPFCLKFHDRLLQSKSIRPSMRKYR